MALDIGGGDRGEGGALSDSVDTTPPDKTANRFQKNYNPVSARYAAKNQLSKEQRSQVLAATLKQYIVKLVANDVILASPVYNGVASAQQVIIAKPHDLRRTEFDGLTVGAYSYVYTSASSRIRTTVATGASVIQTVQEPYVIDSDIVWAAEGDTGLTTTTLLDINASGKRWSGGSASAIKRYRLVTQGADTLSCFLLDSDGVDSGSELLVVKSPLLRRTPFDGLTYNSIGYVYSTNSARVATNLTPDSQNEIIIPPFIDGTSIIHALDVENNTGIVNPSDPTVALTLMDQNVDGRQWCRA